MRHRDRLGTVLRLTVEGLHFRVIESRPDDGGETIVLIHGIGMSHRYLARLHEALARSTRVVSLDLPGFGGLPKPSDDLDIVRMARAVVRVLAGVCTGPVVIVGHSMGAQWAIETVLQGAAPVTGVVVIGPVVDDAHRSLGAQAVGLARDTLGESLPTNWIVFSDYVRSGPRWYLRQVRHMLRYPTEDRIRDLDVPVLVLRGAKDPVAGPSWSRRLAASASSAQLVEIPGRHHVVQRSAPADVAAVILERAARWRTPPHG